MSVDVDVLWKQKVCGGRPTWGTLGTDLGRTRDRLGANSGHVEVDYGFVEVEGLWS